MRMIFVSFIVVLFISGKCANSADQNDNIEASGETEIVNNDEGVKPVKQSLTEEQLLSENEMPPGVVVKPSKRSKKSAYQNVPLAPCGYSDQYAQPSVVYNAPPIAYAQPSHGGYPAPSGYGQPQHRPKYGGRRGTYGNAPYGNSYLKQAPVYQPPQPSYQQTYQPPQPSYQQSYHPAQPSYQSAQPSYQPSQPSYHPHQPSYHRPQTSYQQPQASYQPAPVYSTPSYDAPATSYNQPSYSSPSYSNQVYSAPGHPVSEKSYSYSSPSPSVPCASNVLVGCQPHVSEVPCSGYPASYGTPAYGSQPQYSESGYRSNSQEDTPAVASSQDPTKPNNEVKPDKPSLSDKIPSKTKDTENSVSSILSGPNVSEKSSTSENINQNSDSQQKDSKTSTSNQKTLSFEDAKKQQEELMAKFEELKQKFPGDSHKQSSTTIDQGKQQQQNVPSSGTHQEIGKQNMAPLPPPPPPPTSTNVGIAPPNPQYYPQNFNTNPPQRWT